MQLPGGIWKKDVLRRDFSFRPVTGGMEMAIAEIACGNATLPSKVTAALRASVEHLGGEQPTHTVIESLCVADRQFLMRCLSVHLGKGETWITAICDQCGENFDFLIRQWELPVKEAGRGFPFASVRISAGHCRIRVPNGADQVAIATVEDSTLAMKILVGRCMEDIPGITVHEDKHLDLTQQLSTKDLNIIETAVEEVAPEIATVAQAVCPECRHVNNVKIDPYICLQQGPAEIYSEIHTIASTYHWSETEILAMPKIRRQLYLRLIDRSRGMVQ